MADSSSTNPTSRPDLASYAQPLRSTATSSAGSSDDNAHSHHQSPQSHLLTSSTDASQPRQPATMASASRLPGATPSSVRPPALPLTSASDSRPAVGPSTGPRQPAGAAVFKAPGPTTTAPSSKAKGKAKAKAKVPTVQQQPKGKATAGSLLHDDDDLDDEDDDDDDVKPDGKKKRKRVERACYSCRQRRSKCDGTQPCAVCTHAKVECSYPPPPRRVSMKYVEELEHKLRDLEERDAESSEDPSSKSSSAGASSSRTGSGSHGLPGPSLLAAGALPPIGQLGASEGGIAAHYAPPWSVPAGRSASHPGFGPSSQVGGRPGEHEAPYRQANPHSRDSGQPLSDPYPPQPPPPFGSSHQLPPLLDPQHQYPLPSPAYDQKSRWDVNPLATLADLTTTQMRPSPLASPFPTPLSNYSGGGGSGYPATTPYGYHAASAPPRPPQLPSEATATTHQHPATPQYTPPSADLHRPQLPRIHPGPLSRTISGSTDYEEDAGRPDPDEEALKPVFEDAIHRWERAGKDGKDADFVERAAARYTGKDISTSSHAPEPGHNIDQSVVDALAPSPSTVDMFVLPPRAVSDALVDFYYHRVHHIFPVLSWSVFHRQYVGAISGPEPQGGSRLKASEQIIRAIINLVLAISAALRCIPGDSAISGNGFRRAQALVSVPHLLLMGNLPIIQYLLLLCFHSQSSSKGNLSANAAGLGLLMARGIQLDSREINETFAPEDARVRERVWFCALQMESTSSAMLYRSTTTTERDFDVLAPPSLIDDEGELLKDPLRLGNNEAPKPLGFFRELCTLIAIKAKILRSLYMLQGSNTFPDSTVVLQVEEELLNFWTAVPNYLKIKTAPDDSLYRLQAHILQCRYNNTRIMLYRPFLFHFCSTPGGTYPIPDSLRFNLARKSARVCLDCAVEQVELVLSKTEAFMRGSFWFNLGHLYTSSLVLLAHRLVNMVWPSDDKDDVERISVEALRRVMDYFIVLGWHSSDGLPDGEQSPPQPPSNAIKTARRIYRIVRTIDKVIKRPADVPAATDMSGQIKAPPAAVGPNRYARYPDPTVPPLHLAPPENIPFSDDAFMSSWISLMQPNYRDGDIVPVDFNPPLTPFDLSRQNLGSNTEGESNWQGWESLLGMGYFSNLMAENGPTDDLSAAS